MNTLGIETAQNLGRRLVSSRAGGLKNLVGNKEQIEYQEDPSSLKGHPVLGSWEVRFHCLRILMLDRSLPV